MTVHEPHRKAISPAAALRVVAGIPEQPKPPPQSIANEQAVIGAIFHDNSAIHKIALTREEFFDPLLSTIFGIAQDEIRAGRHASPRTLMPKVEHLDDVEYDDPISGQRQTMTVPQLLGHLLALAPNPNVIGDHARVVAECAAKRLIIIAAEEALEEAHDCSARPEAAATYQVAKALRTFSHIAEQATSLAPKSLITLACDVTLPKSGSYLVKGLLSTSSVGAVYAASQAGKTFWSLRLCYHLALGKDLAGRRVKKAPVLYICLEGQADFPKRLIAARDEFGDPGKMFATLNGSVSFALSAGDTPVQTVIAACKQLSEAAGQPTGLIVIDTLARALGEDPENTAETMGALLQKADRIREATGATVLLIHHPGKDEERGMRGSGALHAGLDTVLRIDRDQNTGDRTVFIEKAKDGRDGIPLESFRLEIVDMGTDDEGDTVTSCVARPIETIAAAPKPVRDLNPPAKNALAEFREMLLEDKGEKSPGGRIPNGVMVLKLSEWRPRCKARGLTGTGTDEAEKKAFQRAFEDLQKAGLIATFGDLVWLLRGT